MSDKLSAIRAKIAATHHIVLPANDPIMMQHTMNEFLILETTEAMAVAHSDFLAELEVLLQKMDQETKTKAERLISVTLDAHKKALDSSLSTFRASMSSSSQDALKQLSATLEVKLGQAKKIALLNAIASGITCVSVLVLGVIVIYH